MTEPYTWVDIDSQLRSRQTNLKDIPHPAKSKWQGLTDDELREMLGYGKGGYIPDYTRNFVDAIEAKLKEKNT